MTGRFAGFWSGFKRRAPPFAICAVIVAASLGVLFRHYRDTSEHRDDLISRLETKLLDLRFVLRGPALPTGRVGVLALDEKSVQTFGRWPFPRRVYEQAFHNLKGLGVKWIGFDVTFSEPERTLLEDAAPGLTQLKSLKPGRQGLDPAQVKAQIASLESMLKSSPGDASLAKAIKDFGHIVLGYFFYSAEEDAKALGAQRFRRLDQMLGSAIQGVVDLPQNKQLSDYHRLIARGVVTNNDMITAAGSHFAFFNNEADDDAIMRWVTLVKVIDNNLMPSLSLKLAAEALDRDIVVFFDDVGVAEVDLVSRKDENNIIKIPVDPNGIGRILINHRGPSETIRHFSFADAYAGTFTASQKKALKNAILLMGPTAVGINDQRANPFDPVINGVETHAAVVDNIVRGDFMRRPVDIYQVELCIVLAIGLLFSPLMVFGRAAFSGLAAIAFLVGYYYFDKYYWFARGTWAYIGMPFIEIFALYISTTLYKYMTEEREKKKVKGAFQHYLSPAVINQVLDDPDALKLGGERKELTVFFSDVRGFTTISEKLSPEKLSELMNLYFTPMTNIILSCGGLLDKYIGDAIMAFWGAPLALPDAADRAAMASLQMLFALDNLREELAKKDFPKIDIGIGLNTGPMSVGNMGSNERFCYTVMGDAVNLGSRLEGLTKEYGIKILISEFTEAKLTRKDLYRRDLDDIRVKGKHEPVRVFELVRPDILRHEEAIKSLMGEFNEGRIAYRAQDWVKARKHFMACLQLRPDDGPTNLYLKRLDEYEAQPQIPEWDGVYTFSHK